MSSRTSVSLLVSPDLNSNRVLLVERNPVLRFMGGYYAFPGGTLDPEDSAIAVAELTVPNGESPDEYRAFVVCAVRELFEETGVLMTHGKRQPDNEQLQDYRQRLLDEEMSFAAILEAEQHYIDGRDFRPMCRITTPPFAPRRYDTWFFRCELPAGQQIQIWPGELTNGHFSAADEALANWRAGDILIVPPVRVLLGLLKDRPDDDYLAAVHELTGEFARGSLHRVSFNPGILLAPLKSPTLPPATHTNCYLVGEEKIYIIDPAAIDADEQARLWNLLDELQAEDRELGAVILTHNHADHMGAAGAAKARYEIPLYGHAETIRLLPELEFDGAIEHEQEIPLGTAPDGNSGWAMTAYHTPGHALGHLVFKENRYNSVIAGDLVSTLSSIIIDPSDGHLATYMQSLEFLRALSDGTVYPAHGPPARVGRDVVTAAIHHRKEREEQIFKALTAEPQSTQQILPTAYPEVDPSFYHVAERALISGLTKLEEDGRALKRAEQYSRV